METKDAVIIVLTVVVIVFVLITVFNFLATPKVKTGYTKIEGFLELRAYPKTSEVVPTVMVYVLIPMYDQYEIYLTEDGIPLSSVEEFSENDLVEIKGVLYKRDAVDGSEAYWMIEVFNITEGD